MLARMIQRKLIWYALDTLENLRGQRHFKGKRVLVEFCFASIRWRRWWCMGNRWVASPTQMICLSKLQHFSKFIVQFTFVPLMMINRNSFVRGEDVFSSFSIRIWWSGGKSNHKAIILNCGKKKKMYRQYYLILNTYNIHRSYFFSIESNECLNGYVHTVLVTAVLEIQF